MSISIVDLPLEIIINIISYFDPIEENEDLLTLGLANKYLYYIIQPFLYDTVRFLNATRLEIFMVSVIKDINDNRTKRLELIKNLDLSLLSLLPFQFIETLFQTLGNYIEGLNVSNVSLMNDYLMDIITKFKKLKRIFFRGNSMITDFAISCVANNLTSTLVELRIYHIFNISGKALAKLILNCTNLILLDIRNCSRISSNDLKRILKNIPRALTYLTIKQRDISLDSFIPLIEIEHNNLKSFDITLNYDFCLQDLFLLFSKPNFKLNLTSLTLHLEEFSNEIINIAKELAFLQILLPTLKHLSILGITTKLLMIDNFVTDWKQLSTLTICPPTTLTSKLENSFRKRANFKLILLI